MNENQSGYQIGNFENNRLTGERYLSENEYEEFIESSSFLKRCNHTIDLYNFVMYNYNDLIDLEERESRILKEIKFVEAVRKSKQFYLDLNRLLLNYLSIVKSFIDYLETDFNRTYGKESHEVKEFRSLTAYCFDNSFAYRFFYKLRNYAQHIDLPISDVKLNVERQSKDKVIHYPKILFSKKELLQKYKDWGVIVGSDLADKEDEFEVFALIEDHIQCIKYIYHEIVKIRTPMIFKSISFLDNLIMENRKKQRGLCVFRSVPVYENNKLVKENIDMLPIQIDLIDYFKDLVRYGG